MQAPEVEKHGMGGSGQSPSGSRALTPILTHSELCRPDHVQGSAEQISLAGNDAYGMMAASFTLHTHIPFLVLGLGGMRGVSRVGPFLGLGVG